MISLSIIEVIETQIFVNIKFLVRGTVLGCALFLYGNVIKGKMITG